METRENHSSAQVRNYTPEDYPAVKQILEEGGLFDPEWDSEEKLRKRISEKPDSIIVATVNSEVVGNVFLADDLFPYVFRLAVRPNFRRRGIGEQLMSGAVKRLKDHGHKEIAILVDDGNEELKSWYIKQGFTLSGKYRSMWKKI